VSAGLTRRDIADALGALGLRAGMGVNVHSSLRSFGHVAGGAPTVIGALQDVLTTEGTLLMPSFNHGQPFEPGGPGVYDPTSTPTTNGAIPDAFWRMPDVLRSFDPTHPFAAWGKHARRYTLHHHRTLTMGSQSPLGLLLADDGYGLLLGVDYRANTFHHVVETMKNAPCLGKRSEAYPVRLPDGRHVLGRTWGWRGGTCPFTDSNRYADLMQSRGLHRQATLGGCSATFFRLAACFDVVSEILRTGGDGFPPCAECQIRPRVTENTAPSDWDASTATLTRRSVAREY
jgi:aminoglycoside 3-N-acetyltransferase